MTETEDLSRLSHGTKRDVGQEILDSLDELKEGRCRYNCRTQKEAFVAGFFADLTPSDYSEDEWQLLHDDCKAAYRRWKKRK